MLESTRHTFDLFIEKADLLNSGRFQKIVREDFGNNLNLSFRFDSEGMVIQHDTPDDDATAAFILTFRFFIQNNEAISFHNMSSLADQDPGLSQEWADKFNGVRDALNNYLDSFGGALAMNVYGETLTRRRIMEVFIYGGFAHANPRRRAEFIDWQQSEPLFAMAKAEFNNILMTYVKATRHIADLCKKEIERGT